MQKNISIADEIVVSLLQNDCVTLYLCAVAGTIQPEKAQLLYETLLVDNKHRIKTFFSDVKDISQKEAIEYLASFGYLQGNVDSMYDPERAVSRAEFVVWPIRSRHC